MRVIGLDIGTTSISAVVAEDGRVIHSVKDFYKPRWEMFFEKCLKELSGIPAKEINWFEWEWDKVRNTPLQ